MPGLQVYTTVLNTISNLTAPPRSGMVALFPTGNQAQPGWVAYQMFQLPAGPESSLVLCSQYLRTRGGFCRHRSARTRGFCWHRSAFHLVLSTVSFGCTALRVSCAFLLPCSPHSSASSLPDLRSEPHGTGPSVTQGEERREISTPPGSSLLHKGVGFVILKPKV